jgi:predicted nuclease of predicted toxin-antitoxin system
VRFLVDECLSVELVTIAAEAGYEAHHLAHVGKAGWKDWNVLGHACENDFVLVTNNAADFRKLYAEEPLHAGLVILIPNVTADLQKQLFSRAVGKLTEYGEPINRWPPASCPRGIPVCQPHAQRTDRRSERTIQSLPRLASSTKTGFD